MSEYLQILQTTQDLAAIVMFIVSINLGLVLVALIIKTITQIRTNHMMDQILTLENRILSQIQEIPVEMMIQGTPITLEDLIQRDLMEQTAQVELTSKGLEGVTPMTDEELLEIMEETTGEKMT